MFLDYRFIRQTEERYRLEVGAFLNLYRRDKALGRVLQPLLDEVGDYLVWLRWVGWNISNLGPALFENTGAAAERLALAMLAYVSGRLIDDGLDNHETYKARRASLVGVLRGRLPQAPTHVACVQSAFVGFCLFQHAVRRMAECGHDECAATVRRLFEVASVGVLGECFVGPHIDAGLYKQIVSRKAVAYNMILYKPFLDGVEKGLRLSLLTILADMDELAQLINDYQDVEEDGAAGRMNAFTHGVHDRVAGRGEIRSRLRRLRSETSSLPPAVRAAVDVMFENVGIVGFAEDRSAEI